MDKGDSSSKDQKSPWTRRSHREIKKPSVFVQTQGLHKRGCHQCDGYLLVIMFGCLYFDLVTFGLLYGYAFGFMLLVWVYCFCGFLKLCSIKVSQIWLNFEHGYYQLVKIF